MLGKERNYSELLSKRLPRLVPQAFFLKAEALINTTTATTMPSYGEILQSNCVYLLR